MLRFLAGARTPFPGVFFGGVASPPSFRLPRHGPAHSRTTDFQPSPPRQDRKAGTDTLCIIGEGPNRAQLRFVRNIRLGPFSRVRFRSCDRRQLPARSWVPPLLRNGCGPPGGRLRIRTNGGGVHSPSFRPPVSRTHICGGFRTSGTAAFGPARTTGRAPPAFRHGAKYL